MIRKKKQNKKKRKNPQIITKRLIAEILNKGDFDYLRELFSIEEIHEMMKTDIRDEMWTSEQFFNKLIENGPQYVWYYKNKPIGIGGFDRRNNSFISELTFTLNPKYWKQGFATEIVWALIDEASEMNIKRLILLIHPDNKNSIKVAEKTGFEYKGIQQFKHSPDHLIFIQEL